MCSDLVNVWTKVGYDRAQVAHLVVQKQNKNSDKNKKTNDDKNMTFPVFLNSFSYLVKIEFRNK